MTMVLFLLFFPGGDRRMPHGSDLLPTAPGKQAQLLRVVRGILRLHRAHRPAADELHYSRVDISVPQGGHESMQVIILCEFPP